MVFLRYVLFLVLLTGCMRNVQTEKRFSQRDEDQASSCFSPDETCDSLLVEFIRSAKKSVDVAVFDVTHPQIVHELLVAARRIPVRIVVDRRQARGKHSLVSTFVKAGANVRAGVQRGIMHHKFIIVDGEKLETGSFNFTVGASQRNQENQVYLNREDLVRRYQERFEKIWKESRDLRS